ncbi:MAG: outer membrane beta-barrel protein [Limisphaerales bacterium]
MSKTTIFKSVIAGAAIFATANVQALDFTKSYFGVDAGASFVQGETLKDTEGQKAHFNPGVRADLTWGLMLNQNLGLQLQTGVIWNHMKRVGNVVPPPPPATEETYESGKGELYQIPLLLNVVYKICPEKCLSPYLGVGAGGEAAMFDAQFPSGKLSDTDFTFAYQAFGGLRYKLCSNANVALGYKFLGTTSHDWKENSLQVRTDKLFTHAVVLALTWHY